MHDSTWHWGMGMGWKMWIIAAFFIAAAFYFVRRRRK
jgi:hypothetical protein